ncbi:MAG: YfiT family bacillithiol transferase [Bacteroidota bacterium]
MITENTEKLKYPIGRYTKPAAVTTERIEEWKKSIETFPERLRKETENLTDAELNYRYRPESWTIRQLIHHCADSHMNAFIRFKLALTEDHPTVKPYDENKWSELLDTKIGLPDFSVKIIEGLHHRWVLVLQSMSSSDYKKTFYHPENKNTVSLDECLAQYAWHAEHHLAHIIQAKQMKF